MVPGDGGMAMKELLPLVAKGLRASEKENQTLIERDLPNATNSAFCKVMDRQNVMIPIGVYGHLNHTSEV